MIRVIRQGEGYVSPWFERELKLISPNFSVIWDKESERFIIVSPAPNVFIRGYVEEFVVSEDDQYAPLDSVVLEAIRKILYEKQRDVSVEHGEKSLDPLIKKMKRERIERKMRAMKLYLEMKGDFYKKWGKLWKTKTFT